VTTPAITTTTTIIIIIIIIITIIDQLWRCVKWYVSNVVRGIHTRAWVRAQIHMRSHIKHSENVCVCVCVCARVREYARERVVYNCKTIINLLSKQCFLRLELSNQISLVFFCICNNGISNHKHKVIYYLILS